MSECQHRWIDITMHEVPQRARFCCMDCQAKWVGEPGSCPCHLQDKHSCWTTEVPTKPGFYWFREIDGDELFMVEVDNDGTMWRSHYIEEEKMTEGQWAGPLEPPV